MRIARILSVHAVGAALAVVLAGVDAAPPDDSWVRDGETGVDRRTATGTGRAAVVFAWAGGVTPTRARVTTRIDADTNEVRLWVSPNSDFSAARVSGYQAANLETDNGVVRFEMGGLEPGISYHYAAEVEGQLDLAHRGAFRTPVSSAFTFTFAFASCAFTGSSHPVFDTIRNLDPLFFLHTGDLHYENIGVNIPDLFRAAYDAVLASPRQSELYRSAPIVYMWDDHDYGPNNSDATAPGREAARQVYQQYVPHYPLVFGQGDVPIAQAFSVGRVRFLVPDSRSERDPYVIPDTPSKTMLGPEQKQWFEQELLEANGVYPVIVWVNTLPWIGTTGDDGWYLYTYERAEIADFIALNGIEGVVMLSGDAHMLAIDDGTNSDYSATGDAAIPVFHAAALDHNGTVKGGPYSHGAYPGGGQFGVMTVEDDGLNPICIDWSGRNESDEEVVGYRFCQPVAPPLDTDGDGYHDIDDCAFADAELWAPPVEVSELREQVTAQGQVELTWYDQAVDVGQATRYDIVGGRIDEIRSDGGFARAACVASDIDAPAYVDGSSGPPSGEARYYLLRARNGCGSVGYGHVDAGDPRFPLDSDHPCPFP